MVNCGEYGRGRGGGGQGNFGESAAGGFAS